MRGLMAMVFGLGLAGCGGSAGLGVTIYGEEFIEEGIPAEVFADGWTVEFDSFIVAVGELEVAEGSAAPAVEVPTVQVFDLAQGTGGGGHSVAHETVPAGAYDNTSYVIGASAEAVRGANQTAGLDLVRKDGYSVYVAGTATKGEIIKTFAWGFATRTRYEACMSRAEVHPGGPSSLEITVHGDHLFYDDLFSETPAVRFDLIAQADTDDDGEVTQAELAAVDIRPLANYQVGSTGIVDLWRFIEHLTTTLGHIDGEGHCEAVREL